jgi:hypothetical protein
MKKTLKQKKSNAAKKPVAEEIDSFEPDPQMPVIRQITSEDTQNKVVEPLSAEERAAEQDQCEQRQQMLTAAMDKDALERQKTEFTGSVVDHTILVAQEAEKAGAHLMDKPEWAAWHEMMYAKHLPFSQTCYKLFRRAAEGRALQDQEFVKLLVIGRMREKGCVAKDLADKMAAVHVTKTHMYTAMQRDIESNRLAKSAADKNEE